MKNRLLLALLLTAPLTFVSAPRALASATFDQYGGLMSSACTNTTGHFILTEINNHWSFCDPDGHVFISNSVGSVTPNGNPTYDCQGNNTYNIYISKYGDATYTWGLQTLRRLQLWGFNSIGQDSTSYVNPNTTCTNCSWAGGVQPIMMPYLNEDKPAEYAMANYDGYLTEPIKDVLNGVNSNYQAWRGGSLPDVFDTKLATEQSQELNNSNHALLRSNNPWILGEFTDDSDYFWGSGAGPDFASAHTNTNTGWVALIAAPMQTLIKSTRFGSKGPFLFSDAVVHIKANALSPSSCSTSSPCSLRDYLWNKYQGSINALNAAWTSNYTTFDSTGVQANGELVGTGDGQTTVFSYTVAHSPLSPQSIVISVAGTAQAGDCPWYIHSLGCDATATSVGSIVSPTKSYITEASSSINYSNGLLTITFANPPASGAAITISYTYNGWMSGGTGLMDESGSNTAWVGTNPYCLEGADPNYPTYFSCVGGGGPNNAVPNANPQLGADLDAWVSQAAAEYFQTMRNGLRAVSQIPYLGLDTMGSWGAPAFSRFLEGAAPYVDAAFVNLHYWYPTPSPNVFESSYQYITQYLGDVPLLNFSGQVAQPDSAMSCWTNPNQGDLGTQVNRGQQYYDMISYLLSTPGYNNSYPFVGFDWWGIQDFQDLNQGLVSIHDNAYDGVEAVIATGVDQWGYPTGGETANYGDAITSVANANALWYAANGTQSAPPPPPPDESEPAVWRPGTGTWWIDPSGKGTGTQQIETQPGDIPVYADYDGDGIDDMAVWRPSTGTWYIVPSSDPTSLITTQYGAPDDVPVPADYDGDGKADIAVWRPDNGTWYIIPSSNPDKPIHKTWGITGDIPVTGDYDGDGKADYAVWRPSTGTWYVSLSSTGETMNKPWGQPGDIPVEADYDGDGKTDYAIWRPSTGAWWIVLSSTGNTITQVWGVTGDIPVVGDYNGDGKADYAIWRPSTGTWYIQYTSGGTFSEEWGTSGDIPAARLPSMYRRNRHTANFDGDRKSDIAVFRPSTGKWWAIASTTGKALDQGWGVAGDIPVPGDYDGDGKTDDAIWRPSTGTWWVKLSSTGEVVIQQWGVSGDIPVPGDYDGDGKTDYAIWRPSTGTWWVIESSTGDRVNQQWGQSGDIPVPGDYDGDGKTDYAIWRPSSGKWWLIDSSTGKIIEQKWGESGDIPVPGDYDGDTRTDFAVFRPSTGTWYTVQSSDGKAVHTVLGLDGDIPVAKDYDGDEKTDIAVFRPSNATWYILQSSNGKMTTTQWGLSTDVPVNRPAGQ